MDALKLLSRSTGLKTKDGIGPRVPSEGSRPIRGLPLKLQPGSSVADTDSVVSSNLGKRKRDTDQSPTNLTEGECRGVLKHYKIKISDLRALQNSKSKGTKKEQKELARIFPQPMTSFDELRTRYGVHHAVAENVADHGYRVPTEVQLASIPLLLQSANGPDLLTIAPTGGGKTLAFLIPLVQGIVQMHRETAQRTSDRRTSALILAPTKELVAQIVNEGRKLSARTGVSITAVRKGMRVGGEDQMIVEDGESSQSGEEQKSSGTGTKYYVKSDILVSTPLSLVNAISAVEATHRPLLPHIKSLVLDEADVLLDPLFREQTLSIWKACTNPALQATMWSATIGSNIEELVMKTIKQRQIDLSIRSERSILRCVVGLKDSAVSTIEHKLIYAATEPGKLLGLRQLLHPPSRHDGDKTEQSLRPPFLVFTQTIERATALYSELLYDIPAAAGGPERVAVLHSELSDTKRSDVMARFRKGQIWVLITTDLLSRGVDFRGVNGVVNYDIPTTTAAYVHRAGRTGRAGREGGVAVTFYTKDDIKYVKGIANVIAASEKAKGNTGPGSAGIEKWVLDALPDISKNDRKELKHRGVEWRRGVRGNDDEKAAKAKRKARIGTKSGYEIQKEKNRWGAIEATRRQQEPDRNDDDDDDDDSVWSGF